jgi:succinoglycan biosynthesis protein ExoV
VKLYQWEGATPNFGDGLNTLLWPHLLPGLFDDDPTTLFLGIGSVLDSRHPAGAIKLVAGAGYGGYQKPAVLDTTWLIHWVRGPRTARLLGRPASQGLGDPAMLLPLAGWHRAIEGSTVGFMPHFESLTHSAWHEAAALTGLKLIDPREEPAGIITSIGQCGLLITEAMHGAIVADALRVPWIALRPQAAVHRAKWLDWSETLDLTVRFRPLTPSSLFEWLRTSQIGASRRGRQVLALAGPLLDCWRFVDAAAASLRRAVACSPQLSSDAALSRCQNRMLERLEELRRDPFRVE